MQAKKRYLLLFTCCAFLAYWYFGGYRLKSSSISTNLTTHHLFELVMHHRYDDDGGGGGSDIFMIDYIDLNMEIAQFEPDIDDGTNNNNKNSSSNNSNNNVLIENSSTSSTTTNSDNNVDRIDNQKCRMETCFDFTRCHNNFKVFVYPPTDDSSVQISPSYQKVLNVLTESRYYTMDPNAACLFVLSLDTLDRDRLSVDYVRNMNSRLHRLPHWNNGINHVIFNLYSGTWPNYTENNLDFDTGKAILAKASMSLDHVRTDFDISTPLFHRTHPERGGDSGAVISNPFPIVKNHLLVFKGKRYVHGLGSDTRNALYHLHNRRDVIMLTTCRHGKNWKYMKDDRCDEDNREYDRYDYDTLMRNSTFCLVPRGRRLGSYRFLEALQMGCIPVLLSNGWALPFGDVIDWSRAVIWADERLVLQIPDIVRTIPNHRIIQLRQQTQVLWERYFSSIEKIVCTTLEIIRQRLPYEMGRDHITWNTVPGALVTLPTYSDVLTEYPFYYHSMYDNEKFFTAVIYCQSGMHLTPSSHLYKLVNNVANSKYASKILIVWSSDKSLPPLLSSVYHRIGYWSSLSRNVTLDVIVRNSNNIFTSSSSSSNGFTNPNPNTGKETLKTVNSISQRFHPHEQIETSSVLSLDEDSVLTTDEIDFAFVVWREFPDRIVGYPARSHYWDDSRDTWGYTSKWTNDYSLVLTGAAFYHRYYNVLYTYWLSPLLHKTVEQSQNCEDILMNFLVSHVTRRPPIKVTQRKLYKQQSINGNMSPWNDPDHFIQRQTCLNTFATVFGYMPLLRSNFRLDPILFKDPVSNRRKKYKKLELVGN